MNRFKIGDKVRWVGGAGNSWTGHVIDVIDGRYKVQWIGAGVDWYEPNSLMLVPEAPRQPNRVEEAFEAYRVNLLENKRLQAAEESASVAVQQAQQALKEAHDAYLKYPAPGTFLQALTDAILAADPIAQALAADRK